MSKLLPNNSTSLEKSIVSAFESVLDSKDILIKKLYNADECPTEFLVYLAWFFNVDFSIYNKLEEPAKREYIKQSINIHRRKGTLGALKEALKVDGYDIEIVEWYESGRIPHTANIKVSGNKDFDIELIKQISNKNKNVQTILNFIYGLKVEAKHKFAIATKVKLTYRV